MERIRFEWDPRKAASNRSKHGVTFEEATSAFEDVNALVIDDPDHSAKENRFVLIGVTSRLRVVVVAHCYRDEDSVIRIISARRANGRERTQYSARITR